MSLLCNFVDAKSKVVLAASNVVSLKATKCMSSDIVGNRDKIMFT